MDGFAEFLDAAVIQAFDILLSTVGNISDNYYIIDIVL